jgi:hypothetical protein
MFEDLDALGRGTFFLECVVNQWPLPCSLDELGAVALATGRCGCGGDGDLMLVLIPSGRLDSEDHLIFQVRKPGEITAHLTVTLSRDGRYLTGSHGGSSVDETGVIDALALYAPFIGGSWEIVELAP